MQTSQNTVRALQQTVNKLLSLHCPFHLGLGDNGGQGDKKIKPSIHMDDETRTFLCRTPKLNVAFSAGTNLYSEVAKYNLTFAEVTKSDLSKLNITDLYVSVGTQKRYRVIHQCCNCRPKHRPLPCTGRQWTNEESSILFTKPPEVIEKSGEVCGILNTLNTQVNCCLMLYWMSVVLYDSKQIIF